MAAAVGLAALAYRDFFDWSIPPWRWAVELLAGGLLLTWVFPRARADVAESQRCRRARRSCLVLAIPGGALGVLLARWPGWELQAGGLLGATLAFLLAWRWVPLDPRLVDRLLCGSAARRRVPIVALALGASAVLFALTAALLDTVSHLAAFVLWIAGLCLLPCAARVAHPSPIVGPSGGSGAVSQRSDDLLVLIAIVVFAGLLRFAGLDAIPELIDPDEGRLGASARELWQSQGFPDLFGYGWNSFPNLAYAVQWAFVPIVGESYIALRASAAAIGVVSLIPTFYWVRRWWGLSAAIVTALLLAVNLEHLIWSRVGYNNIHTVAVAALMLAALARALQRGAWLDYVLFGYASGLGFLTYHAAKVYLVLLIVPAAILVMGAPSALRRHCVGALVSLLAFAVLTLPYLATIHRDWNVFYEDTANRVDVARLADAYRVGDTELVRSHLQTHVANSLAVFIREPTNLPLFDPFAAIIFLLGCFSMGWSWRDPRNLVTLGWVAGLLVLGSMMTDWPPNKPRLLGLLPAACAITGVTAARMRCQLIAAWPRWGPATSMVLLCVWLSGVAFHSLHAMLVVLPPIQRADVESFMCRRIRSLQRPTMIYTAGSEAGFNPRNALANCTMPLPPDVTIFNLALDGDLVPLPPSHQGDAILFIGRRQVAIVPLVRFVYPEAREETVRAVDGVTLLHTFSLNEEQILSSRSLRVARRGAQGSAASVVSLGAGGFELAPEIATPHVVELYGQVWIPTSGEYAFRVDHGTVAVGWGRSAGEIPDGGPSMFRADLMAGWHPLRLQARMTDEARSLPLRWLPPGEEDWRMIPAEMLFAHVEPIGIQGDYDLAPVNERAGSSRSSHQQIHSSLSFEWRWHDDDRPPTWFGAPGSVAVWSATVDPGNTPRLLRAEASVPLQVFVNGELVIDHRGDYEQPAEATVGGDASAELLVVARIPAGSEPAVFAVHLLWQQHGGGWTAFMPYVPRDPTG